MYSFLKAFLVLMKLLSLSQFYVRFCFGVFFRQVVGVRESEGWAK